MEQTWRVITPDGKRQARGLGLGGEGRGILGRTTPVCALNQVVLLLLLTMHGSNIRGQPNNTHKPTHICTGIKNLITI